MLGNNPIRQPLYSDGMVLEVKEIYRTLQGEGPFTGQPALFVRLGGCNLACKFCDTEFEGFKSQSLDEVMAEITELAGETYKLAVITGGEPLRQSIGELCTRLLDNGFRVQIETNGTIFRELDPRVSIVCSPKNQGQGYSAIRADLLERLAAIKFIVSAANSKYSDIAEVGQSQFDIPVYIQPMDEHDKEKNARNLELALKIVQEKGYNLSLQTHKIIGIP